MIIFKQKASVDSLLYFLSAKRPGSAKAGQKGFSLVETLVVIFVSVVLLMALFTLFDWHSSMYRYEQALVRVSGSSRASLQAMDSSVRQAHRILASQDINGTNYSTGTSTLVLQLPAIDASGEIIQGKSDYAAYYGSGADFFQVIMPDATSSRRGGKKILSDTLYSITLTYDNADFSSAKKVSVDLQTRLQVRDQTVSSRDTQNMYLKNY